MSGELRGSRFYGQVPAVPLTVFDCTVAVPARLTWSWTGRRSLSG
jgi:hypothetical protein